MGDDNLKRLAETTEQLRRLYMEAKNKISAVESAAMDAATAIEELEELIYMIQEEIEVLQEAA